MSVSRTYVDLPLAAGELIALPDRTCQYLGRVLRLAEGDAIRLFNGDGRDYPAKLERRGRQLCARVGQPGTLEPASPLDIELWLGISRGERMDLAIQKAVELGASVIRPLFTERCQVRLAGERRDRRLQHWRGVVISACEQSGRQRLPAIEAPQSLTEVLSKRHGTALLLDPEAKASITELATPENPLALLIGPEGGLTADEREQARGVGFVGVRLGPRILRTETAPLAALAAVQTLWGDFR
jgi:16S rRNA (uracil1498-N3)-methyltransferase